MVAQFTKFVTQPAVQLAAAGFRPSFIIDPRSSTRIGYWDAVTASALIFTAIVTPFEVGLVPTPETAADGLFIINRFIDLIFIIDMCVQFLLAYEVTTELGSKWVLQPRAIVAHYLRGWFVADFVSVGDLTLFSPNTGAICYAMPCHAMLCYATLAFSARWARRRSTWSPLARQTDSSLPT